MNKNMVIGVIVVIVLVLGGWWLYNQNSQTSPAPQSAGQTTTQTTTQTVAPSQPQPEKQNQNPSTGGQVTVGTTQNHEVIYTDAGYSPATLTIKAGDTVVFKNQSSGQDWVASAMHPTHAAYTGTSLQQHCPDVSGTAFDECKADNSGDSWSFTFTKTGTWEYHNHVRANHFGKIIVE